MLGGQRERLRPLTDRLGTVARALRLKPDHVTWASLVIAAAGAWLVADGRLIVGAIVVFVAAGLDAVDGALARLTGKASLRGGYLDSLLDRFVDFFVLLAIMVHVDETRAWIVGAVALFGSVTTSFAKARVFQDLHPDPSVWRRDLLERGDRYLLILPVVFAQGIVNQSGHDVPLLWWLLVVLAALSVLTVLQRMRTALRVLGDADHDEP